MTEKRNGALWGAGLVAAGAIAGAVLAGALPAGAQTSPTPSPSTQTAPRDPSKAGRAGETPLTGTNADKAKAAALKAVPGATVERVETDADGDAYEAHVVRPDGTHATVKLAKDFTVLRVEECGGHRGPGDTTTPTA